MNRFASLLLLAAALAVLVFAWNRLDGGSGLPERLIAAPVAPPPRAVAADREQARFGRCQGRRGNNCVIDGDTLFYAGRQIRIADIDAPEIGSPQCDAELARARRAKDRLQTLLNAGRFTLQAYERPRDVYGRELLVITRGGRSLGAVLIAEGLAHPWVGHKLPWCR
jgi:endonuclease YncB( thermonuclease family)